MEQPTFKEKLQYGENNLPPSLYDSNLPCLGHLKKLLKCKTARVVPQGHEIFTQGDSPHTICIICSGLVKLTHTEPNGTRVIVGLREGGNILGAVSSLLKRTYSVTAETITRSKLCFVPVETFTTLMDTNIEFSKWVSLLLSRTVRYSIVGIIQKSCLSGRERLEKFLWKMVQTSKGGDRQGSIKFQMILKNWEVAQSLALTPQYLCRLIKQMEKEGVIVKKNGWLILPEPKRIMHPEMEMAADDIP